MENPLVSCVCVTFDRPDLLNELLYCFLAQKYENKELIIINDQTDIQYVYNDSRVRIINLSPRFHSLGTKREFSKHLVQGEYFVNMDDDDIYYSNHLNVLMKHHLDNPEYDAVANRRGYYSEYNEGVQTWNIYVAFNGACIKTEYLMNNRFPLDKSCGEDQDIMNKAKILFYEDEITFHYRWGLDVHHISGMGGDGIESYNIVTKNTVVGETRIIELKPQISEKVKLYYR